MTAENDFSVVPQKNRGADRAGARAVLGSMGKFLEANKVLRQKVNTLQPYQR